MAPAEPPSAPPASNRPVPRAETPWVLILLIGAISSSYVPFQANRDTRRGMLDVRPAAGEPWSTPTAPLVERKMSEASAATWRKVTAFQGTATTATEPFTILSDRWRASYKYSSPEEGNLFSVSLIGDDPSDFGLVANEANRSNGEGTTNFYKPGTYHLEVNCMGVGWGVLIEELR